MISTTDLNHFNAPLSYPDTGNSEIVKTAIPLNDYLNVKSMTFRVGHSELVAVTSSSPLKLLPGALTTAYKDYWATKNVTSLQLTGHYAVIERESEIRFFPNISNSNEALCVIGTPSATDSLRSETIHATIRHRILRFHQILLGSDGLATTARMDEFLAEFGLEKWSGYVASGAVPAPAGKPATYDYVVVIGTNGQSAHSYYWIPSSFFFKIYAIGTYFDFQSMTATNRQLGASHTNLLESSICPQIAGDLAGIGLGYTFGPGTSLAGRNDLWPMSKTLIEAAFPYLLEFRAKLAKVLNVGVDDLQWGGLPGDGFGGFYLILPSHRYTLAKSSLITNVLFRIPLEVTIGVPATVKTYTAKFDKMVIAPHTGVIVECSSIGSIGSLSVLSSTISSDDTTATLKQFVSTNPGSSFTYTKPSSPWFDPGVKVLEETNLYRDAISARVDLYSRELFQGTGTTFKMGSNKANGIANSVQALTSVRTSTYLFNSTTLTLEDISLGAWTFNNSGIVSGIVKLQTVVLNANVPDDKLLVELALVRGASKTFSTTEADFCQIYFNKVSIASLDAYGVTNAIKTSDYDLNPLVLSPSGFTFKESVGMDADKFKRLFFIHANTTTSELVKVSESALNIMFRW